MRRAETDTQGWQRRAPEWLPFFDRQVQALHPWPGGSAAPPSQCGCGGALCPSAGEDPVFLPPTGPSVLSILLSSSRRGVPSHCAETQLGQLVI